MITIDEDQLSQVEYLLQKSMQGVHVLFDSASIRRVFSDFSERNELFSEDDARQVEQHIENLMAQPTLLQKRTYLERLSPREHDQVLRSYFNIVENNMYETGGIRH